MTLREKNHDPTVPQTGTSIQRKYSVSQSGKYKSRPKIRPSLSGDLFRPDATATNQYGAIKDGNRTENEVPQKYTTGSSRGHMDMTTGSSSATPSGATQQNSRGVYETAL